MESASCEFLLKLESHENSIRELCAKKQALEQQLARQEDSLKEVQNKLDEFINKDKSRDSSSTENENNSTEPLQSQFKQATHRFVSRSYVPGITRIYQTDRILIKLVWIICLLICFALLIQTISLRTLSFLSYAVITDIVSKPLVGEPFPAITVCSNRFKSVRDMLISCHYDEDVCNESLFDSLHPIEFLNCLRFNGYQNRSPMGLAKVKGNGERYSLSLVFNESIDVVTVFVTDNLVNYFNHKQQYVLQHGIKTKLIIDKSVEKKLPEPYNKCTLNENNNTYRQINCQMDCVTKTISANCSQSNRNDVCAKYVEDIENECEKQCPWVECDMVTYRVNTIQHQLVNETGLLVVQAINNFHKFLEINQMPKETVADLVASFGGAMGLFMGLRVLNLVEIFEYFIDLGYILATLTAQNFKSKATVKV